MNTFDEIVGHENIIMHIRNGIKMNKISHAYIIEGEEGIGKKTVANVFAKTLQCEKGMDTPCNECPSCKSFDGLNHPDIKIVMPSKKTGLGVDDIREQVNMDINIKPYKYPYKIYLINEADTMTIQAQNALLKTIEEPPYYAIIMLIANNGSLFLPTVLSRCVNLTLKPIEEYKIVNYLIQKENISEEKAKIYASFSRGNIGRAKLLLNSEEFEAIRNDIIKLVDYLIDFKDIELIEMIKKLCEYKDKANMILDLLMTWLRDLLLIKKLTDEKYIIHKDKYKTLLKHSEGLSYNRISILMDQIEEINKNLRVNVNYQLSLETAFFVC